jgi:hypothetical protein
MLVILRLLVLLAQFYQYIGATMSVATNILVELTWLHHKFLVKIYTFVSTLNKILLQS